MKLNIKKVLSICIGFILIISFISNVTANALTQINKDETVYSSLDYNGIPQKTSIVNRLIDIEKSTFVDFGKFTDVKPLRKAQKPEINNGRVIWDTSDYIGKDFYYEGTITKNLPVNVSIKYFFEGLELSPEKLAGKSGNIDIHIDIKQNKSSYKSYQKLYMTQVQLQFNMDNNAILESNNSADTIVGKYKTLTYTILPDEDKTYKISLNSKKFSLDPITIILLRYDIDLSKYNDMVNGLNDITDGMKELNTGSTKLESGFSGLSNGINDLDSGIRYIYSGAINYKNGLNDYKVGLSNYKSGLSKTQSGLNEISSGFSQLNKSAPELQNGYQNIQAGLEALLTGNSELSSLATTLLESEDPRVQALAAGVIAENVGLKTINSSMTKINSNFSTYLFELNNATTGLNSLTQEFSGVTSGFEQIRMGFNKISNGYNSLLDGIYNYKNGVHTLNSKIDILPGKINTLTNGQNDLYTGLNEFNKAIKKEFANTKVKKPVISFADESIEINSLQFIMKTPKIALDGNDEHQNIAESKVSKSIFVEIWDKIVNLFK